MTVRPGPIVRTGPAYATFVLARAIGAVVARFVHTEEVTGSNPVSPTRVKAPVTTGAFVISDPILAPHHAAPAGHPA